MKKLFLLLTSFLLLSLFSCGENDDINPVSPTTQNKGKLTVTFKTDKPITNSTAKIALICSVSDWVNPNGENRPIVSFPFTGEVVSYTTNLDAWLFGANYYYETENDYAEPYNLYVEAFIGHKKVFSETYLIEPVKEFKTLIFGYPND